VSPEVTTTDPALLTVKFTQEESHDAFDSWSFNCGPAAIAAVAGLTLNDSCGTSSTGLAFVGDCGPERPWK
jgi:hypothetical protein